MHAGPHIFSDRFRLVSVKAPSAEGCNLQHACRRAHADAIATLRRCGPGESRRERERERWSCRVWARAAAALAASTLCPRRAAAGIADSHGSFAPSFPFAPSLLSPHSLSLPSPSKPPTQHRLVGCGLPPPQLLPLSGRHTGLPPARLACSLCSSLPHRPQQLPCSPEPVKGRRGPTTWPPMGPAELP